MLIVDRSSLHIELCLCFSCDEKTVDIWNWEHTALQSGTRPGPRSTYLFATHVSEPTSRCGRYDTNSMYQQLAFYLLPGEQKQLAFEL